MRERAGAGGSAQCMFQAPRGGYLAHARQHADMAGGHDLMSEKKLIKGQSRSPLPRAMDWPWKALADPSMLMKRVTMAHATAQLGSVGRGVDWDSNSATSWRQ